MRWVDPRKVPLDDFGQSVFGTAVDLKFVREIPGSTMITAKTAPEGVAHMGFDIAPGALMMMIFFSLIGIVYFRRGKSVGPASHMVYGIALMIYPYFVTDLLPLLLVGLGISALSHFLSFG